ncbi:hypothetical protein [Halobacterium litoreum]|uniref:Uncharacterized protein n=1 Tax=Halobacterium litoreum TaxID=2039234 RepID=A0ABD5NC51_9EURY|nr:hypothetical protein [Halobacterium litoreum]UHH14268.1 hypothetical protein LT972_04520 [Halobacterium litoreum]
MKRRAFVGVLATTAFAGCAGVAGNSDDEPSPSDDTTTEDDETTTPTEREGDGPESGYDITDVETDDVSLDGVSIEVSVAEQATTDRPASLRVAFTNEGDEPREFQFGSLVPWDALWGDADTGGELFLAPDDGVVPEESPDGCWQATDGVALASVVRSAELDAGETVSRTFAVLAPHEGDACVETGTYRFEGGIRAAPDWGFDVEVRRYTAEE